MKAKAKAGVVRAAEVKAKAEAARAARLAEKAEAERRAAAVRPAAPSAGPSSETDDERFKRAASLENVSPRLSIATYEKAANNGHGPSQKRLWEILTRDGRLPEAAVWQRKAFANKVPGVPEPAKTAESK